MKGHKSNKGHKGHQTSKDHGSMHKDGYAGGRRGQPRVHGKPRSSLGRGVRVSDKNED